MRQKLTARLLVAAVGVPLLLPGVAMAGSKGRKNTALLLTGVAAHQLLTGKTTTGLIAGAGAAYAWKRHKDARNSEKRRARITRSRRYHRYARVYRR
jgi:hypothetical protein